MQRKMIHIWLDLGFSKGRHSRVLMCLSVLLSPVDFFFNSVMDEAEILELKAGTPRRPASKGLTPWVGGCVPVPPRGHAWVGRDAHRRSRSPRPAFPRTRLPLSFSPGTRKLNCDN